MSDPSHVNRILTENCENCRVTAKQNSNGSSVTQFCYEFCLQPVAKGFVGETPPFSTGRTGAKLDWFLKFGPDFRFNLHLLRWSGCDDVKVHVVSCWKLPLLNFEAMCRAINENLDPSLPLPSFWSVKLPAVPGEDYHGKLLLDISLEDRVSSHVEHLGRHLTSALEDGRFSDVTLVAGDRSFQAHRVILSQRCPTFWKDRCDDRIILDEDPRVLEMLLEFVYTGRLRNVDESYLDALLTAASNWRLHELQNLCTDLITMRNVRQSHRGITVSRNGNDAVILPVDVLYNL